MRRIIKFYCIVFLLSLIAIPVQVTSCDINLPGFVDYSPYGMPDFDQKQKPGAGGWTDGVNFTHCGPLAAANMLWWLDSRYDSLNIAPPVISDDYPLVTAYAATDDHDGVNVVPLVEQLATLMKTNQLNKGTSIDSLVSGIKQFLNLAGVQNDYQDSLIRFPSFDDILDKTYDTCAIVLLLSFYEQDISCCIFGGHFVTIAGASSVDSSICISDPYFDAIEGEPPVGIAHGATDHNDASLISGPHGQNRHDSYTMSISNSCGTFGFEEIPWELNWPLDSSGKVNYNGQNRREGSACSPSGAASIKTIVEYAYILCPQGIAMEVGEESQNLPEKLSLAQNFPNPFNPDTRIKFTLSSREHVLISVYNMSGQLVKVLQESSLSAGTHYVDWDGTASNGKAVASGLYFYKIDAGNKSETKKMVLLK